MTTPPPVEGSVPVEEFMQLDTRTHGVGFWASAAAQAKQEYAAKKWQMQKVHVPTMTREEARRKAASMLQSLGTDEFDTETIVRLGNTIGTALTAITNSVPNKDGSFVQEEPAT